MALLSVFPCDDGRFVNRQETRGGEVFGLPNCLPVSILTRHFSRLGGARWKPSMPIAHLLGTAAVFGLVVAGLALQIEIGRINRDPHSELNQLSAEVDAGRWIRSHTDANT